MIDERIMPVGKYKGKTVSECPLEYLDWIVDQEWFTRNYPKLCEDILKYLRGCPEYRRGL